jgi:transposase
MRPNRHVRKLSTEEQQALRELYRQTEQADVRTRCQMILLSAQGHTVVQIAEWTLFDQDSVLYWFARYEAENLKGLQDRPRPGRPPKSGSGLPG